MPLGGDMPDFGQAWSRGEGAKEMQGLIPSMLGKPTPPALAPVGGPGAVAPTPQAPPPAVMGSQVNPVGPTITPPAPQTGAPMGPGGVLGASAPTPAPLSAAPTATGSGVGAGTGANTATSVSGGKPGANWWEQSAPAGISEHSGGRG